MTFISLIQASPIISTPNQKFFTKNEFTDQFVLNHHFNLKKWPSGILDRWKSMKP